MLISQTQSRSHARDCKSCHAVQFIKTDSVTFQSALKELFSTCHQFPSCNTQLLCTWAKKCLFYCVQWPHSFVTAKVGFSVLVSCKWLALYTFIYAFLEPSNNLKLHWSNPSSKLNFHCLQSSVFFTTCFGQPGQLQITNNRLICKLLGRIL